MSLTRAEIHPGDLLIREIIAEEMREDELKVMGIALESDGYRDHLIFARRMNLSRHDRPFSLIKGIGSLMCGDVNHISSMTRCDPYTGWPITLEWVCRTCRKINSGRDRCVRCKRTRR